MPSKKEIFILGAILGLILAATGTYWFKAQTGLQPLPPTFPDAEIASRETTFTLQASSVEGGTSPFGSGSASSSLKSIQRGAQSELHPSDIKMLVVYIVGAVRQPGVYELPMGSRLTDAVQAAGGFSDDADREAINLALPVVDGSRYALPRFGDNVSQASDTMTAPLASTMVNLNTADQAALETLPNIGPARAKAILDYRARKGSFRSVDELKQVSGIGESIFAQLRELVVCE